MSLIDTALALGVFGVALGVLILWFLSNGLGMLNLATEWQQGAACFQFMGIGAGAAFFILYPSQWRFEVFALQDFELTVRRRCCGQVGYERRLVSRRDGHAYRIGAK